MRGRTSVFDLRFGRGGPKLAGVSDLPNCGAGAKARWSTVPGQLLHRRLRTAWLFSNRSAVVAGHQNESTTLRLGWHSALDIHPARTPTGLRPMRFSRLSTEP